jgi:hypothetical protein
MLHSGHESPFEISSYHKNAFSIMSGSGAADYTQLLIDYWHYREGLSGPVE